jgi:hypothetical protein
MKFGGRIPTSNDAVVTNRTTRRPMARGLAILLKGFAVTKLKEFPHSDVNTGR